MGNSVHYFANPGTGLVLSNSGRHTVGIVHRVTFGAAAQRNSFTPSNHRDFSLQLLSCVVGGNTNRRNVIYRSTKFIRTILFISFNIRWGWKKSFSHGHFVPLNTNKPSSWISSPTNSTTKMGPFRSPLRKAWLRPLLV